MTIASWTLEEALSLLLRACNISVFFKRKGIYFLVEILSFHNLQEMTKPGYIETDSIPVMICLKSLKSDKSLFKKK